MVELLFCILISLLKLHDGFCRSLQQYVNDLAEVLLLLASFYKSQQLVAGVGDYLTILRHSRCKHLLDDSRQERLIICEEVAVADQRLNIAIGRQWILVCKPVDPRKHLH